MSDLSAARSRFERMVSSDHPDRRLAQPATEGDVYFFIDPTHERPLCVARLVDGKVEVIAQFTYAGDCARAFSVDGKTLPAETVRQLAGQ